MSDKNFKVKNNLILNGNAGSAGVLTIDATNTVSSVSYVPTQYGGTGTSTSPTAGQILYSSAGTTYSPSSTSVVYPTQSGNSGKFLTTDGSSVSWGSPTLSTSYDGGVAATVYTGGINGGGAS